MKIQCSCGVKYSFDVTPEMAAHPVQFICAACGVNSSSLVNQLIQQQLAGDQPPVTPPPPVVAASLPPAPAPAPAIRIAAPSAPSPAVTSPEADAPPPCLKHVGQFATNHCVVCQKPMCPQCMALFGWVCSPLCKSKAEANGIHVPEYDGQKSAVERQQWHKIGRIAAAITGFVALLLGAWFWYAWFGSVPKASYTAKFSNAASSGGLRLAAQGQTVVLHGGRLARHDSATKREVWSLDLLDRPRIADQAAVALKEMDDRRKEAGGDSSSYLLPPLAEITRSMERGAESALSLHVSGENIWVESDDKLVQHDWNTGKAGKEIAVAIGFPGAARHDGELVVVAQASDGSKITRIDLASGDVKTETIARPNEPVVAAPALAARGRPGIPAVAGPRPAPGARPLDPATVARQAQNMPLPNRLALPATVAAAANQQRLMAELNEDAPRRPGGPATPPAELEDFRLIRSGNSFVQLSSRLIESRTVTRKVMKAPPKKSALDGPVNQAATAAIANEILNDMTRDRLGDTAEEDESLYQATVRRGGVPDWTGDVIGHPSLVPLQTVDVVLAGKSITVLDKNNKKLWDAKLTYPVSERGGFDEDGETPSYGLGPCVERGDTFYLFDQGVLTCFELPTGNARWRLPTIGTAGLFFDDKGMIYVNTTTASPDSVKYTRQVDISAKTHNLVLKVDPKTGKTLWGAHNDGQVNYISGKFIYTVESHVTDEGTVEDDGLGGLGIALGVTLRPHVRIKRLNPSNGRVMWEHFQQRGPLAVQFDKNQIQILFRKELQVLKFLVL